MSVVAFLHISLEVGATFNGELELLQYLLLLLNTLCIHRGYFFKNYIYFH